MVEVGQHVVASSVQVVAELGDQRCSSTPMTRTPSSRVVSAATIICVASMAIALTVSHDRPNSRATAATVARSIINRRRI